MPAPKKNKNAFKHGIYSRFFVVDDDIHLEGMKRDENKDELAIARVRLVAALDERIAASDDEAKQHWDYAVRDWIEKINNLTNANKKSRETEEMIFTSLLDAVRAANDKQQVRR